MSARLAAMWERVRWWVFFRLADNKRVCNASTGCWAAWKDRSQITEGRWRVSPSCLGDVGGDGARVERLPRRRRPLLRHLLGRRGAARPQARPVVPGEPGVMLVPPGRPGGYQRLARGSDA